MVIDLVSCYDTTNNDCAVKETKFDNDKYTLSHSCFKGSLSDQNRVIILANNQESNKMRLCKS